MAVEQHLHRFLLEFFGVNATLGPVLLVSLHGTLLGCLMGLNLSSRSVHKTGYTSIRPSVIRGKMPFETGLSRSSEKPSSVTFLGTNSS
jgi:hypothetical protein